MTDFGPRGPASTFWADPRREERLREMAAQGLSSSLMASALGCSRNSIISKALREGIALTARKAPGRPRVLRAGAPLRGEARQPLAEPAQPDPATAVTIMGLTKRTCRWPLWTGNVPDLFHHGLFCGGDVVGANGGCWDRMEAHLPYCGAHARMAFRNLQAAE